MAITAAIVELDNENEPQVIIDPANEIIEIAIIADIIYLGSNPNDDQPEIIEFTDATEVAIELTDERKAKFGDIPNTTVWFLNDDDEYDDARVPKKLNSEKTLITIQNSGAATGFVVLSK